MRLVFINPFEKVGSQDTNNLQLAMNQSLFDDTLYPFFNKQSGVIQNSFIASYVSALVASLAVGTGFFYDSSQTGYNPKYRMIQAGAAIPVPVTAADPTNDRIDLVCLAPNLALTGSASRYVKTGGTGPITLTNVNKNYQDSYTLTVVAGTPSGSPVAPTLPAGNIAIAQLYIHAATGMIGSGDVTDERTILGGAVAGAAVSANPSGHTYLTGTNVQEELDETDARLTVIGSNQKFVSSATIVVPSGITRMRAIADLHNPPAYISYGNDGDAKQILDLNGGIWHWGAGFAGDGSHTVANSSPVLVAGGSIYRSIDTGFSGQGGIDKSGNLWLWGANDDGQLGNGASSAIPASSPVLVVGNGRWQQFCQFGPSTIGLDILGRAWSWGNNGSTFTLGQGNSNPAFSVSSPMLIAGSYPAIRNIFSASGGGLQIYMLDVLGNLYGWGLNSNGGITGCLGTGNNTMAVTSSPVLVAGGHFFKKTVGAADSTSITNAGLDTSGNIWTWGDGASGQLGDGTHVGKSTPVLVVGGHTFIDVQVSQYESGVGGQMAFFGLDTQQQIWAWGSNFSGLLGNNSTIAAVSSPVLVAGGIKWASLCKGGQSFHPVMGAIDVNGSVYTWGDNTGGVLGQNSAVVSSSSPVIVSGGLKASRMIFGVSMAAIGLDGVVWAWGDNSFGQLGDGTTISRSSPVSVQGSAVPALDERQTSRSFKVIPGQSIPIIVQALPPTFGGAPIGAYGPADVTVENDQ